MTWDVNAGRGGSVYNARRARAVSGGVMRAAARLLMAAALVCCPLLTGGCQTEVVNDRPRPLVKTTGQPSKPVTREGPLTPDVLAATDPCATRLEDIEGLILEFYVIHGHQMPPRLEDVRSLAPVDVEVNFNCPVSKQPYVYVVPGLPDITATHRLIIYDAMPDQNGRRWCVIMDEPKGRDLIMHARQLTDPQFRAFSPPQ